MPGGNSARLPWLQVQVFLFHALGVQLLDAQVQQALVL